MKRCAMMLKVYVLYVHRQYSCKEIGRILGVSDVTALNYLNEIKKISPILAKAIRKQKNWNIQNSSYKGAEGRI